MRIRKEIAFNDLKRFAEHVKATIPELLALVNAGQEFLFDFSAGTAFEDADPKVNTAISTFVDKNQAELDQEDALAAADALVGVAFAAGETVIKRFAKRNRLEGIVFAQTKHVISKTKEVESMLRSGALLDARTELMTMTPDDMSLPEHWITQARIDAIIADIDEVLATL